MEPRLNVAEIIEEERLLSGDAAELSALELALVGGGIGETIL
jgi:hypothetical protein